MITQTLPVLGMHCASCAQIIERKVKKIKGVSECHVNYGTENIDVTYAAGVTHIDEIHDEIQKLGYEIILKSDTKADTYEDHLDRTKSKSTSDQIKKAKSDELNMLKGYLKVTLPMAMVSIGVMTWEIGSDTFFIWSKMPEFLMTFFHHLLPLFAVYSLFVVGRTYLMSIVRFIQYRVANMDTLIGIGTSAAFLYSFMLSAFENALPVYIDTSQNYYDVTIVVICFVTLGKYLENRSKIKTSEAVEKLISLQLKSALVERSGKVSEIALDEIVVGDLLHVKPGSKIPLDGTIHEGSSTVDESMITGESLPIDKSIGDTVIGSTANKQGFLKVYVTKIGSQTFLSQIIKIVESAQNSKAPIEKLVNRVSAIFVPLVMIIALLSLSSWLIIGSQFIPFSQALTYGIVCFVGVLVIACPCAMGLATPTAIIVGIGRAAQRGILFKNAESIEKTQGINYVVFDKTGTLTKGTPTLIDIHAAMSGKENEILQILAALESKSDHPLAHALVSAASDRSLDHIDAKEVEIIAGSGIQGIVNKKKYYAGNPSLAYDHKLQVDEIIISSYTSSGKTPIILMSDSQILGYFALADTIKTEAKEALAALHKRGLTVAMISGDHKNTSEYIAQELGISHVIAEVKPLQKAQEIRKLQKRGYVVAMVGDGVNDAPALVSADVGIAMSSGSDIALESSDVTLLNGSLTQLPQVFSLSQKTMQIIKQNLFWAFFYNSIGIPIAAGLAYPLFGVLLTPAISAIAMALSSVSVVTNSLRLKHVAL